MITARLSAPAYELGEYADPVTELPELLADPEAAAELTSSAAGFDTYRWSDAPVGELMAAAAQRTLGEAGVPGDEVDLVLLATDSLPRDRTAHRDVAELLAEAGLSRATASTLGLMDCATAMAAVGTAASLVRDGSARHVLVVSGDLADHATGGERIVAGGAAIASDAAATALVSATAAGLPVLGMAHHAAQGPAQGQSPRQQLAARIAAYRELFTRLEHRHPFRPDEVRAVLSSNFARNVLETYLSDVGYGSAALALGNVGRIAHCLGSDPLINLADRLAEAKTGGPAAEDRAEDRLVLLGAGISHLAAVLLGARPLPAVGPDGEGVG
ncbi:acyl carrier protein [Streptomyces sp. NBC_00237]|uniref:acyl carrier protein n=1 Tax=Streptomyces sp. NBC_00237 TaxID=2975687 RepID=UPI002250D865|nr:acyl carrier protein [Streptomyces sp. NBC_00237]MCX5205882.1 acyl carrier protein [Streptomyces sp. NBC_00237]